MNKTNIIVGAIAVVALILGGISFFRATPATVASTQSFGNTSIDGSQSNLPNPSNSDYSVARLAQGFGTNLSNSNTGAGNINIEAQAQNMISGTTTVCTLANPFNATSTITGFVVDLKTGVLTGGGTFAAGTTTSGTATTTGLFSTTYASSSAGQVFTWDPGSLNGYLGPTGQVTLGFTAGSATGTPYSIVGTCSATFQSVL
jgi:hypothetical protein